jgi:hypothetical protein
MKRVVVRVAVALVLALAGCSGGEDQEAARPDSSADGQPPPPSVQPPPVAIPYVAITNDGRVLLVRRERTVGLSPGDKRLSSVTLSPDGRIAYVGRFGAGCGDGDIQALTLEGQPSPAGPPLLTGGAGPAVSPDGARLAYVRPSAHPCVVDTLVVRDLRDGGERAWTFAEHELSGLTWAPDNRRLAFEDSLGPEGSALVVFDTATPPGPVTPPEPLADQEEGGYTLPAFGGQSGTLLALNAGAEGQREQVVSVDVRTGSIVRPLFTPPQHLVALDADASGRHILAVDQAQNLYYWGDAGLVRLGTGVIDAAW